MRDFITNLPSDSAVHRKLFPKSWWWTPDIDFAAAQLHSTQVGNWQRGGGKGPRPNPISRPKESTAKAPATHEEANQRKKALRDELERRRKVSSS